jgi:hypothetical protein
MFHDVVAKPIYEEAALTLPSDSATSSSKREAFITIAALLREESADGMEPLTTAGCRT